MLKLFSRLEKTRNFILLLFASLMVVSLVVFYAPTRNQPAELNTTSTETVAKVGSEVVTLGEVATQKENQERMFGGRIPVQTKRILDGLVGSKIVKIEAEKLGFLASDEEVANQIREQFKNPDGRPFDQRRYEQAVISEFGSVKKYEDRVRESIVADKLEAFITSGVTVAEEEILDDFKRRGTKFDLNSVAVNSTELAATIKPSEEELKTYFEQNKKNYYISSPQKKIRYVFINQSKVGEKLQIPEAELKAEYDQLPNDKKQAGVQVQQIVLRVSKPELDAQVLAKANEIVAELRKDNNKISEEDFGKKAQGFSEDPKTANNGGKLGGLVRSNPNNPKDPLQQTLTMEVGTVTEPIKFGTGYYIFRRGEAVPKTFEDAKKEIEISLRNRRSYTAAAELAQKITDKLKEVKDVQKVAEEFAGQANMSVTEMVRETGFVKKEDDVPNIGVSPQFEEGIANLNNPNDVGDKIPIKDGFAIPLLVDKKDPRDAEFSEVKDKVTEAVKIEQAKAKVETIAKEIASGASSPASLSGLATAKGLKASDSKGFILGSPVGQGSTAATSKELEDAINNLKVGEVTKNPIKAGDNWYIVGVSKREEPNMEEFSKQRDQLLQSSLMQKRGQVFGDYLADLRRKMDTAGQIKIYKEVLDKIQESEVADQPDLPFKLPQ